MSNRVVVKDNWESSLQDQLSEWFYTWIVGGFLWGGIIVTGFGAAAGYFNTPQDESPYSNMAQSAVNYNVNTWKAIGMGLMIAGEVIHEIRPNGHSEGVTTDNEEPKPTIDIVKQ